MMDNTFKIGKIDWQFCGYLVCLCRLRPLLTEDGAQRLTKSKIIEKPIN